MTRTTVANHVTETNRPDLEPLFCPRSIAVVGALTHPRLGRACPGS